MKTLRTVLISLIVIILISASGLFIIGYFKPKPAGLTVQTSIATAAYIDGNFVGRTPLDITSAASEIDLKLVPLDTSKTYVPFEAKVNLTPGIKTIVRRTFAESEDASSGEVVSFEKDQPDSTTLVAVSIPENAQITLDGVSKGFSPVKTSVSPGVHTLTMKSPGYADRSLSINTVSGYKLTVSAQLAKTATPTVTPTPTSGLQTYVLILSTPTGYLRVRTQPGTGGSEIDQIKPGSKYLLLAEDAETHWFKIQLEPPVPGLPEGRTGWISNQYAEKVDQSGNPIATPSATPVAL